MDHIHNRPAEENQTPGKIVILPSSSSPCGHRAMHQHYQDAVATVDKNSSPDYFVTFKSKPKWQEITENLCPGEWAQDRPDLLA